MADFGHTTPWSFLVTGGHALVHELLHALAAIGLGREDVALGVGGDAVHGIEFAGLPSAVAEAGQNLQRLAVDNVDLLVRAVGQIDVLLLRVLGERDVPDRAVAQGVLFDESLP